MVFTEESITGIAIDMGDEWQWMSENEISVKFYGLEDYAERFWEREKNCPDGWIDCYAKIVVGRDIYVKNVEFILVPNNDTNDKCLNISIVNRDEGKMIAKELFETSNDGLFELLKEGVM
jgi:hypothetical protein